MELIIDRTYFPDGTNGKLACEGKMICKTIELPWKENEKSVSCVPEGKYLLKKRYSAKYKWHIEVVNVPGRKFILFHSGPGLGLMSRNAFNKLRTLVFKALDANENVFLTIQSTK